jgi:hypothetical protein
MSEILSEKHVKTRKEHVCWGCAEKYPKGEYMWRLTHVDSNNTIYNTYLCEVCEEYEDRYLDFFDLQDGYCQGALKQNDFKGWEELRNELMGA